MGVIEEVGADVKKVKVGQRYVSCFDIGCGECFYCKHNLFSCCMRSNPSNMTCGLYGHKLGGFYGAPLHMSLQEKQTASTLWVDAICMYVPEWYTACGSSSDKLCGFCNVRALPRQISQSSSRVALACIY